MRTRLALAFLLGLALLLGLGGTAGVAPARAFDDPADYEADPAYGGGGGRYFTGSPYDGLTCEVCHLSEVDPIPTATLLGTLPPPTEGWIPGTRYELTFESLGTTEVRLPAGATPERLGAVVEVTDLEGNPVGTLEPGLDSCAAGPRVSIRGADLGRQIAVIEPCSADAATLTWQAPPQPVVGVTAHIVAVYGNTDTRPVPEPGDEYDQVVDFTQALPVAGDAPMGPRVDNDCSASPAHAGSGGRAAFPLLAGLAALVALRRRR